ncbi:hypothetical protein KPL70_014855 [Citrus sinensis]|uniref:Uncharacterized protein n=1 Tax=Citrus sinensis TaxID=2711 RepID=A0ACB8KH22_CITSI|nr:hypothetical protein KPL70_014855 [Citrus sinensis]KAH9753688.1 hypothetical protein KPL71_015165 [Citrus sinensis]
MLRLIKLTLSVTNNFKIYTIPPGQLRHHPPLANNKTLFDIDLLWLLHFQRNIVRGVEGFVAFLCTIFLYSNIVARKLAEDCCKYGAENQSDNSCVARAALQFGTSHDLMENERETLLGILHDQVIHPFDAQANGELSLSIDDYVVVRQVALMDGRKVNARAKLVGFPRHT